MPIEKIFGWMKSSGGLARGRLSGIPKTKLLTYVTGAAYNLLRMAKIEEGALN